MDPRFLYLQAFDQMLHEIADKVTETDLRELLDLIDQYADSRQRDRADIFKQGLDDWLFSKLKARLH